MVHTRHNKNTDVNIIKMVYTRHDKKFEIIKMLTT